MDCRNFIWAGLLLLPLTGCTYPMAGAQLVVPQTKMEGDETTIHQAGTFVAYGDCLAASSVAKEFSPQQHQQFREEARLKYLKALEIDPKYLQAFVALARLHLANQNYPEAISTLQKALAIHPTEEKLWYELGMCQCRQKQWNQALVSLEKALELNPSNRQYQATKGYTLARAERLPEALATLTQIHGEAKANFSLARMLHQMHQDAPARQYAEIALSRDPSLPGLREFFAELNGQPAARPDQGIQQASLRELPGTSELVQQAVGILATAPTVPGSMPSVPSTPIPPPSPAPAAPTPSPAPPASYPPPQILQGGTTPPAQTIPLPPLPVIKLLTKG